MKFRHKLLLFGLAAAAVTALAVFIAGGALLRRSVSDRVKERLESEVAVLSEWVVNDPRLLPEPASPATPGQGGPEYPGGGCDACDDFADRMGRTLHLRVTVIAQDGRVLGDSELGGDTLLHEENHAHRPEVIAARRSVVGTSTRQSTTVHDELLYMARRVMRGGKLIGFVRLAIPVHEMQRVTGGYSAALAIASLIVLVGVATTGYFAARRFSRPLEDMSRAADAIAAGRRDLQVQYGSRDEIGHLGASFNRMTRALSEQIAALWNEKMLRDTILGGMKEGILVVDRERRVLLGNDAVRSILGLRGVEMANRPLIEMARDRAVIEGFDAALLRGEVSRQVITAAGSGRSFEINIAPLTDPHGALVGAIGLLFDTTRLAALESVRRDFVADVSHELRTPLTSIKAFVETLLTGGLEDSANNRRFLEIVKKHSDRMEAILDDLTDLSLIETGAVALEIERFDLSTLIHDLIETFHPKAEALGVSLEQVVPAGTMLAADRRRVEQVFVNLIDNAIKFNRKGGKVIVRAHVAPSGLCVEVEDTGVGIPGESLEKVFHRFYRVDRARSRDIGGTGLGLSIVKHLMQLHGGTVRLVSQLGRGCTFILEFPLDPVSSPARADSTNRALS